jgi:hypothetical protein
MMVRLRQARCEGGGQVGRIVGGMLPARCGMPAPSRGIIRIVLGNRGPRPTARVGGGGGGRLRCGRAERSDLAVAGSVPSSVPCRRCSASMSDIAAWRDACDRPAAARIGARFDTGQITSTPTTTSTSRSFGILCTGWRTLLTRARHREQSCRPIVHRPRPARGVRPGRGAQRALLGAGGLDAVPLPAWRHPDVGAGATGRPVGLLGGGWFMTAADMLRVLRGLATDDVLAADLRNQMNDTSRCLGWDHCTAPTSHLKVASSAGKGWSSSRRSSAWSRVYMW